MRIPFRTQPGHNAAVLSEAQAMLESGQDRDIVLAVFEQDADWLAPLLDFSEDISDALDTEPPSYYFEASLKSRFLEAANERRYRPAIQPAPAASRVKTGFASATVLAGTAVAAFATLGFVTADNAVPGDWNYSFKTTQERMEYALARGDNKLDVQINQTQARVYEIQVLTKRGSISPNEIHKLEAEVAQLRSAVEKRPTDDVQKQQLRALQDLSTVVLNAATEKNEAVKPAAASALSAVTEAVAAGGVVDGGTAAVREPSVSPTPVKAGVGGAVGTPIALDDSTPTAAATSEPTLAGAAPGATLPPVATATPTTPPPTPTAEPETPTATATTEPETPTPTETATPTETVTSEPTELTSTAEPAETATSESTARPIGTPTPPATATPTP